MTRHAPLYTALAIAFAMALPTAAWAAAPQATTAPAGQAAAAASATQTSIATLQVNGGVIMLSRDGAAFTSGASGAQLAAGERLMVSEQSSATVTYSDGCKQNYDKPGVYTIEPGCTLAAVPPAGGAASPGISQGAVVGGVLAGAALIGIAAGGGGGHGQAPVPPVSH